ncbi:hypothetical protein BGZ59_004668 [Podila verticillata]|nr:hypothetical protein BGZ59_004668 [Podila verticillata]KFH69251.1 hypothetical protein MVEG_04066 [Podila verticillata NRRL 6337]
MKTTTSGRAFAKGIFDLFATLMISLPIETHKLLFKSFANSFTAEEAIANLGGLKFIQANHDTDPKDPTRIITRVVTTQFSLPRDMAKNLCQTFMDARLFESAMDPGKREFQNKGIYQVTGKGAHIVEKFVHRNALSVEATRHITANATPRILFLERAEDEDAIVLNQKAVDAIFRRFAGLRPNVVTRLGDSPLDSPLSGSSQTRERTLSASDRCNGIEVKDQQHNYEIYRHTFYGKAAVEWLLDYTTVISKEEAICIAQEFVNAQYIEQVGEEYKNGPSLFRTGNSALYHFTEYGRAVVGWESLVRSRGSSVNTDWMDERGPTGPKHDRTNTEVQLLSAQFKLTSSTIPRLPISVARGKRRSADESSLTGSQYNDDTSSSTRRLSQILNDPAFQFTLSENGAMSSYAASSSGKESVGQREGSTSGGNGHTSSSSNMGSSSQPTTSNTTRLNLILSNATLRDLFKSFLKQNICEENLSFYLEVLDYRSKFNTLINSTRAYAHTLSNGGQDPTPAPHPSTLRELEKQICTQAFAIHETYLVSGAPRELNLPHQMRSDITSYMQAVVRNMETPDNSRSLPTAPTTPSSPSEGGDSNSDDIGSPGASGSNPSGGQRELIHISLFDRIHEHIFRLMSTDSVPKFTKTDKYREVMMNRVKQGNSHLGHGSSGSISGSGGTSSGSTMGSPLSSSTGLGSNGGGLRSPTLGSRERERIERVN